MALSIDDRLGAYEVLSLIGAGGMGEVYRARDTRLKRDVAIRFFPKPSPTMRIAWRGFNAKPNSLRR